MSVRGLGLMYWYTLYANTDSVANALDLQYDAYLLEEWCACNYLKLNAGKCSVVSYTRKRMALVHDYTLLNVALSRSSSAVDLGMIFDDRFTFSLHMSSTVNKANKTLGFIFRNSADFRCLSTLTRLYFALVRPILKYYSVV